MRVNSILFVTFCSMQRHGLANRARPCPPAIPICHKSGCFRLIVFVMVIVVTRVDEVDPYLRELVVRT